MAPGFGAHGRRQHVQATFTDTAEATPRCYNARFGVRAVRPRRAAVPSPRGAAHSAAHAGPGPQAHLRRSRRAGAHLVVAGSPLRRSGLRGLLLPRWLRRRHPPRAGPVAGRRDSGAAARRAAVLRSLPHPPQDRRRDPRRPPANSQLAFSDAPSGMPVAGFVHLKRAA
jgi:hypothetical protein